MFVFENLDLVPGEQTSVIAVKDSDTEDKVKLVARLVIVPKYKYALDPVNQNVYVLAENVEDADFMSGRSFRVDGKNVLFCRVLKMEKRDKDDDLYQSAVCFQVH